MTPNLIGRWQTRVATLGTIGLLITAIFALTRDDNTFYYVLGYVILFGLAWDVLYIVLQQFRWDHDWPAAFQVGTGLWEGVFIYVIVRAFELPEVPALVGEVFAAHYGLVWLSTFVWVQGPMRAFFPRWRFFGGRIV